MIRFRDFGYRYPEAAAPALAAATFELPRGSLSLVTGPSGSGKSTLLRTLNGLVPHFTGGTVRGSVRVAGRDPVAAGPGGMSAVVGFVPGDPESSFVLDVLEDEVALALERRGLSRTEMRRRVARALERVGLLACAGRRLVTLSGGEQQRAAVATALALGPQVLVLDEPTSQLDDDAAEAVLSAVLELAQEGDLTVVISEHRLDRIATRASHLVYLPSIGAAPHAGPAETALGAVPRALSPQPPAVRPGPVVLELRGIAANYDSAAVLSDACLSLCAGEVLALTGPSGSGKSTLLRVAVGLLAPSAGEVRVEGTSIRGRSVAEVCRRVGFLPQNPNSLLFADTVRQELAVTLANHGLSAAPGHEPETLLDMLGLADSADQYPRDLSAGQRQRVALGAVLVTEPPVLLLDEPTRGLDDEAIAGLARLLHARASAGTGVLVATHDRRLVRACHRTVQLIDGRVDGTTSS